MATGPFNITPLLEMKKPNNNKNKFRLYKIFSFYAKGLTFLLQNYICL